MYFIIFIGGGISSLYGAYKLLQLNPQYKIILLEKADRLGGRTWKDKFYNTMVTVGAGILRKSKDKIAINLLNKLNIPYKETYNNKDVILPYNVNILDIFVKLKFIHDKNPEKYILLTFKNFAKNHIGLKLYNQFTPLKI